MGKMSDNDYQKIKKKLYGLEIYKVCLCRAEVKISA